MISEEKTLSTKFKPAKIQVIHVGRRIKSTKIRYVWEFELEKKKYVIDLFISRLSGKRKILVNGDLHANERKSSAYLCSYVFKAGSHKIDLKEIDDNVFDLRVDNISFQNELRRLQELKVDEANIREEEPRYSPQKTEKISNALNAIEKFEEKRNLEMKSISNKTIVKKNEPASIDLLDFSEPDIEKKQSNVARNTHVSSKSTNPFEEISDAHNPLENPQNSANRPEFFPTGPPTGFNGQAGYTNPFYGGMGQVNNMPGNIGNGMNAGINGGQYPSQMMFYNPYFMTGMPNPWMNQLPK